MKFRGKDIVTRIIPATKMLQSIANKGSVDPLAVQDAQQALEETDLIEDLAPYFEEHNDQIREIIEKAKTESNHSELIEDLSSSFANFRSAIIMSNNAKISSIVSEIFFLVEGIRKIDSDISDILEKYLLALRSISKMASPSPVIIENIESEIKAVVGRYAQKHPEITIESAIVNEEIEN
jgi:hypothetical protein